jgi:hypothetical protein
LQDEAFAIVPKADCGLLVVQYSFMFVEPVVADDEVHVLRHGYDEEPNHLLEPLYHDLQVYRA